MPAKLSPLAHLQFSLQAGEVTPTAIAHASIARANAGASHNTYLHFDAEALLRRAESLPVGTPLYGVPISLKDCFDLAGTVTTAGSRFYAEHTPMATEDSDLAARLSGTGALLTGKTHLHPLAYGITGENPDFGDCLQPRDATLLTGGSSSGAAASVQEGSALAALGTDTGGSIRVPAALCGLVGFRTSHAIRSTGIWRGGAHLSPAFDTPGILLKDPRDAAPIAQAIFGIPPATAPAAPRIGTVPASFLHDASPDVLVAYDAWKQHLQQQGAALTDIDVDFWSEAPAIVAPILAYEAARLHQPHMLCHNTTFEAHFEARIAERLHTGLAMTADDLAHWQQRLTVFRAGMARLLARFDFLMLPVAPITRLVAGADHALNRPLLLRYTAPFSAAGLPTMSLPGELLGAPFGTGIQLAAAQCDDASLLGYAATLNLA